MPRYAFLTAALLFLTSATLFSQNIPAGFERIWTLSINEGVGGSVLRSPQQSNYLDNARVTLTAVPLPNFVFVGWGGDVTNQESSITLSITTNLLLKAIFSSTTPVIDIVGSGTVAQSPVQTIYKPGDQILFSANPASGYVFSRWSDGVTQNNRGIIIGTNNHYTAFFTNVIPLTTFVLKQWDRDYGGSDEETLSRVVPTPDGGSLLIGSSMSGVSGNKGLPGFGGMDGWIMKLDSNGRRLWEKVYGGTNFDYLSDGQVTDDGGFILAGYSNSGPSGNKSSPNFGDYDFWLLRIDSEGNKLWEQTFGGSGDDRAIAIQPSGDAGFVIGGYSSSKPNGNKTSPNLGGMDYWILKVDRDGVRQWEQSFGDDSDNQLNALLATADGGFLLGGTAGAGFGGYDFWIVKVDSEGRKQWSQGFGGENDDLLFALAQGSDGGFLAGGTSFSKPSGNKTSPLHAPYDAGGDFWIVKMDANGTKQWDRSFGTRDQSTVRSLLATRDGGFLVGGSADRATTAGITNVYIPARQYWVIKVDPSGTEQWERQFGGSGGEYFIDMRFNQDGTLYLAGSSDSPADGSKSTVSLGQDDYWLVKVALGEVATGMPITLVNGNYEPSGQFSVTSQATVEISTDYSGGSIYYTSDGSLPGLTSKLYTGPLNITSSATIRSIAFTKDRSQSVTGPDVQISVTAPPPRAISMAALGGNQIVEIHFDKPLGAGADEPGNYLLGNGAFVTRAIVQADATWVILNYSGSLQTNFTLTLNNIADLSGNLIAPNLNVNGSPLDLGAIDIGNPRTGSFSFAIGSDAVDVTAFGNNLSTSSDSFHFTYASMEGDFDVAVNINGAGGSTSGAMAGLMVRESFDAGSREIASLVSFGSSSNASWLGIERITEDGLSMPWPTTSSVSFPVSNGWVRLQRRGDTFHAFTSIDGLVWNGVGQVSPFPPFSKSLLVGLSTTAGNISAPNPVAIHYRHYQSIPPVIPTDDDNWDDRFGLPNFNNPVYALGWTDAGDLYAGGFFAHNNAETNGLGADHLAKWNGRLWSRLGGAMDNGVDTLVRALATDGNNLYVAGDFVRAHPVDGVTNILNKIGRWDGSSWTALGDGTAVGVVGTISALAIHNGQLYVGGSFSSAGGVSAANIAKWDGEHWSALGSGLGVALKQTVLALAVADDGTVYAGGSFVVSGSGTVNRIAKWDGSKWSALQSGMDGNVTALCAQGTNLYAGGLFSNAGQTPAKKLAVWNGTSWSEFAGGVTGGNVYSLAVDGNNLYVGGSFTQAGAISAFGIGKWDGVQWTALGIGTSNGSGLNNASIVYSIVARQGVVYAGGDFQYAGGLYSPEVAKWDGQKWVTLSSALNGPSQAVASSMDGSAIYAGGSFTSAGGHPANNIARWNGTEWAALGQSPTDGVNGNVRALLAGDQGDLFAGGDFRQAGGSTAAHIARWDGSQWHAMGVGLDSYTTVFVDALAAGPVHTIFAGGIFQWSGNDGITNVAQWDGVKWNPLAGGVNSRVSVLAFDGTNLYAAGAFTQAGDVPVSGIARWDGQLWHAVGDPIVSGASQIFVQSMAIKGREIFVGAQIVDPVHGYTNRLAHWDGAQWNLFGGADGSILSLAFAGNDLIATGDFTAINGQSVSGVARWNGTNWTNLGSGIGGNVTDANPGGTGLATYGNQLYIAGNFAGAGGKPSTGFGHWTFSDLALTLPVLAGPAPGSVFAFKTNITLNAAGMFSPTTTRVDFYANAAYIGSAFDAPYSMIWSNAFAGSYNLVAEAIDSSGQIFSSAPVAIRVLPPSNDILPVVLITSPTNGSTFFAGGDITIRASATDPDGSISQVEYYQGTNFLGSSGNAPYSLVWTNVSQGNYGITARAVDNVGGESASSLLNVAVLAPNKPPFLSFATPQEGDTFNIPGTITIKVNASDADGQISEVDVFADATLLTILVDPDRDTYAWTTAGSGFHTLTAVAYDNSGQVTSAKVDILVNKSGGQSSAQIIPTDIPRSNFWVPDNQVRALVEKEGIIYLGGDFTHVGPFISGRVILDTSTAQPDVSFPSVQGDAISVMIPDGAGGLYIGGSFTMVGASNRVNLAHLKSDHTIDATWQPTTDGPVKAMTVVGSTVYIAGDFTKVNNQTMPRLAAIDTAHGTLLSWNPAPDDSVLALASSGTTLFVGGKFKSLLGQSRNYLAAVETGSGIQTVWNPNPNDSVSQLLVANGQLVAAGTFSTISGQQRSQMAGFNLANLSLNFFHPDPDEIVTSLAFDGSVIYAAGNFTKIGNQKRGSLAALNPLDGSATSWNPGATGPVTSMALGSNAVYVAGKFGYIGGRSQSNLAAIAIATGLATDFDLKTSGIVSAMTTISNHVIVAGDSRLAKISRNHLAAIDSRTGIATSWDPNADGEVYAMAASGDTLYVSGRFSQLGSSPRYEIGAVDLTTGIAKDWNPTTGLAYAIAVSDGLVYLGGDFASINGLPRSGLAAVNATNGIPTAWNPMPDSPVRAIAVSSNAIYAAGSFLHIGGQPRSNLAALDPVSGAALPWNPNPNGMVVSLLLTNNAVYVGGIFDHIGGRARVNLAAIGVTDGEPLPWISDADGGVLALTYAYNTLFGGGQFDQAGGRSRHDLGALDTRITFANASSWNPGRFSTTVGGSTDSMAITADTIYVGGSDKYGAEQRPYFAAYDFPPRLNSPQKLSVGQFSFDVNAAAGRNYILQTSTNLVNWTSTLTNIGPFHLLDPATTKSGHRYYRVLAPSQ